MTMINNFFGSARLSSPDAKSHKVTKRGKRNLTEVKFEDSFATNDDCNFNHEMHKIKAGLNQRFLDEKKAKKLTACRKMR